MTTSEKQFLKALAKVLDTEQLRQKHKLHPDERRTFLNGWFRLIHQAADRMVDGSRRHNDGLWRTVNFAQAKREEFIDGAHYDFGQEEFGRK